YEPRALSGLEPFGRHQQQEQQDALAKSLVELAGVTRHRAAVREDQGPFDIARPAVHFAVYTIRDAAKEQADRDRLGYDVRERIERDPAAPGEPEYGNRHPEGATVERHSAMPYVKRLDRVIEVISRLVEEDV